MHQKLPKDIHPWRMAQSGIQLSGELAINTMPRLCRSLHDDTGLVTAWLNFDVDEVGTPYLAGQLEGEINLLCQRCLLPMHYRVSSTFTLAMVMSESKMATLADQYEPWHLTSDESVLLTEIIEDELILSLPLIPKHAQQCIPSHSLESKDTLAPVTDTQSTSPFAILSHLKGNQ